MNIIANVTDYVKFLIKHKLSTNQWLMLYLLYTEKMVKNKQGKVTYDIAGNVYRWQDKGKGWTQAEIQDLVSKDYIIAFKKNYTIDNQTIYGYMMDDLILTDKFAEIMFIDMEAAFEEILELYPDTMLVNGSTVFTKSGDLDKLSDAYHKAIKGSIHEHEKIKAIVSYAKERSLCNMKLDKFLSKGVIDPIKKMMEENYDSGGDI
jgi:hypothetical protein